MLTRRELLISAGGSALALGLRSPAFAAADQSLSTTLAAHGEQMLQNHPQLATALGMDTGDRPGLKSRLNDRSLEAVTRDGAQCAARLDDLERHFIAPADDTDSVNCLAARYANQLGIEAGQFRFGDNCLMSIIDEAVTPYVVNP